MGCGRSVRRLLSAVIGLAASLVILGVVNSSALAQGSPCDETVAAITGCVGGGAVNLVGNEHLPGGTPPDSSVEPNSGGSGPTAHERWVSRLVTCLASFNPIEVCAPPGAPGSSPITIRDIASFVPTPGRQQMEPDGWAVAGLHTNFYAITAAHVVEGTLLGRPADVRFTPVAYHWAYGDGTAATFGTAGGTWATLGIPEFEPTPTSHVYEEIGEYTITLSIEFAAEYRFDGGPWRPVIGRLTLPANDLHISVGTAKTVLVDEDCLANPSGPGC